MTINLSNFKYFVVHSVYIQGHTLFLQAYTYYIHMHKCTLNVYTQCFQKRVSHLDSAFAKK